VRRLNSGSKVDLRGHNLAQELELADGIQLSDELSSHVGGDHFGDTLVVLEDLGVEGLEVEPELRLKALERVSKRTHFLGDILRKAFVHVLRDRASSYVLAVDTVEISELALEVVNE